jgi:putative membrane protein
MIDTTKQQLNPRRTLADYVGIAARGFAMGAADVVPGVSGGTMAFILGIYEELINSIKTIASPETLKLLLGFKLKEAIETLPWRFLLALGIGILVAIFSLARFLEWMLDNHPALLWAFFFGLVIASIFTVSKKVKQWNLTTLGAALVGTIIGYLIVGLVPVETPDAPWFLFLSGAIAICAMILPGISGSFILVLMGKYEYILSAVNTRDFLTLLLVAAGAAIGLATFAQVLGWLFKHYHDITVALLIGLMVGSIRKIWPWKETVATYIDRHGEELPLVQINVLPNTIDSVVIFAIILAIVGFAIIFVLDYWASSQESVGAKSLAKDMT